MFPGRHFKLRQGCWPRIQLGTDGQNSITHAQVEC